MVSRGELFAFVWLLLTINALPSLIGEAVAKHGWLLSAFNLFDISAVVWLALIAGLLLAKDSAADDQPDRIDWQLAATSTILAMIPVVPLSAATLTGFSLAVMARSARGSPLFRAAAIFVALSTFLIWGRLVLALGAGPMLGADARFVGLISGLPVNGNMVGFVDGRHFLIAPGCSSLHGISLVLILWTSALAWFDLRPNARLIGTLFAAVCTSIAVNAARLTTIAWQPESFDYWHVGAGGALFGWIGLIAVAGVMFAGLRSALDAR